MILKCGQFTGSLHAIKAKFTHSLSNEAPWRDYGSRYTGQLFVALRRVTHAIHSTRGNPDSQQPTGSQIIKIVREFIVASIKIKFIVRYINSY